MERILLIDGDIFAYQTAAAENKTSDWGDGDIHIHADLEQGISNLDKKLEALMTKLHADEIVVCISDKENFRYGVYPDYKSNRVDTVRPLILEELKQHLLDNYDSKIKPGLEADDVLGILLTNPKMYPGMEKVCVTIDKDLRTVPGLHFNPDKETEAVEVSPKEAQRFHLLQTLMGDVTDGYPGCPGVGPVRANKLLDGNIGTRPWLKEITRGPRKGELIEMWDDHEYDEVWDAILSMYAKVGLTPDDALVQARVARILHHSDFNYTTQEPILWTPTNKSLSDFTA